MGNVLLKAETQHHRVKAVWEQAGDREQAEVTAKVREKAEERDKAAATDGNHSIQNYIEEVILCQDLIEQVRWLPVP